MRSAIPSPARPRIGPVQSRPDEVRLSADRRTVTLSQCGVPPVELSARMLRAACRCAGCRRAAVDGTGVAVPYTVTVARIVALGGNAANIAFSDGHDRGVFPWDYLWTLCQPADPTPTEATA